MVAVDDEVEVAELVDVDRREVLAHAGSSPPAAPSAAGCGRRWAGTGGRSPCTLSTEPTIWSSGISCHAEPPLAAAAEGVDDLAERQRLGDGVGVAAHPGRPAWTGSGAAARGRSRSPHPPGGTGVSRHGSIVPAGQAGACRHPRERGVMSSTFHGITLRIVVAPTCGRASPGRRGGCGRAGARSARSSPITPCSASMPTCGPVVAVAEAEGRRVGEQHVDRAAERALADAAGWRGARTGAGCTGAGRRGSARTRRARRCAARLPRRPSWSALIDAVRARDLAERAAARSTRRSGRRAPRLISGSWLPGTNTMGQSTQEASHSR